MVTFLLKEIPGNHSPRRRALLGLKILKRLLKQHPTRLIGLTFSSPYELLVATVLSGQCTDSRVNSATETLFLKAPNPHALAAMQQARLESLIRTTGLHRRKAGLLIKMAAVIVRDFNGEIPKTMDQLIKLPGVGRKTANVILAQAYDIPAFPVDRHLARVINRLELVPSKQPVQIEMKLTHLLPKHQWIKVSDSLIQHGRTICRPLPMCHQCSVNTLCPYPLPKTENLN